MEEVLEWFDKEDWFVCEEGLLVCSLFHGNFLVSKLRLENQVMFECMEVNVHKVIRCRFRSVFSDIYEQLGLELMPVGEIRFSYRENSDLSWVPIVGHKNEDFNFNAYEYTTLCISGEGKYYILLLNELILFANNLEDFFDRFMKGNPLFKEDDKNILEFEISD